MQQSDPSAASAGTSSENTQPAEPSASARKLPGSRRRDIVRNQHRLVSAHLKWLVDERISVHHAWLKERVIAGYHLSPESALRIALSAIAFPAGNPGAEGSVANGKAALGALNISCQRLSISPAAISYWQDPNHVPDIHVLPLCVMSGCVVMPPDFRPDIYPRQAFEDSPERLLAWAESYYRVPGFKALMLSGETDDELSEPRTAKAVNA